jgi:outer membrane protein OmpA-like peptidoglycan-associated protein
MAAAPVPAGANTTTVSFEPGSSALTPATTEAVKQIASHRNGHPIALTGYGDATSADPNAQAAAMNLAIARAKAVAGALRDAGVPATAIQVGGEAAGRGLSIRLLQ